MTEARSLRAAIVGLLTLVAGASARANDGAPLTLRECLRRALERAPEAAASGLDRAAAGRLARAAGRARLPELSAEGGYIASSGRAGTTDFLSANAPRFYEGKLVARATVIGGAAASERERARAEVAGSDAADQLARGEFARRVASDYFAAQAAQADLAVLRDAEGALAEHLRVSESRYAAGAASRLDVSRARSRLAQLRARLTVRASESESIRERLADYLGIPAGRLILPDLVEDDASAASPPAGCDERETPVGRTAEAEASRARAELSAARADARPSVVLYGAWGVDADRWSGAPRGWQAGVGVTIPLDATRRRHALSAAALDHYTAATQRVEAARRDAGFERDLALGDWRAALLRTVQLRAALEASAEARDAAKAGYGLGGIGELDALDAQQQWTEARIDFHDAMRQAADARVRLAVICGRDPGESGP